MLMIGKQLTAEQRLTKAVVDIMHNQKYVALAGVLMLGSRGVDDATPTAYTDGKNEKYGRAFVDAISDAELRFVVLHECYHKLYRHLTTWQHLFMENAELANQACDYVINIKIADDNTDGFAQIPSMDGKPIALIDERFRGMDTAQVYALLRKEGKGNKSGSGDAGTGIDAHGWDKAQSMTDAETNELHREIDQAIRQGALMAGKVGSGGDRSLNELLQTKVNWRDELREFISTTCTGNEFSTWRRPNRRFVSSGYYMPSGVSHQVGELVIAIDTSGSIGAVELAQFLGEVKGICDTVHPEAIRLLYWDTDVCAVERYKSDEIHNIISSTKPAGGGGTDVNCVTKYLQAEGVKPQAVVVLTDGYLGGEWGTWDVPVLWCIVNGSSRYAPVGKTIHVNN